MADKHALEVAEATERCQLNAFAEDLRQIGTTSVFIPVCFYTKRLLKRSYVAALLEALDRYAIQVRFLFADYLHALNLRIRGFSLETAGLRAKRAGTNNRNMYRKLLPNSATELLVWNDVARRPDFRRFHDAVKNLYVVDAPFALALKRFVSFQQKRSRWDLTGDNETIEHEYLLSEIAMSIIVTEVDGYTCEIWDQQELPNFDPIRYLYDERSVFLLNALGVTRLRRTVLLLPA